MLDTQMRPLVLLHERIEHSHFPINLQLASRMLERKLKLERLVPRLEATDDAAVVPSRVPSCSGTTTQLAIVLPDAIG